MSEEKKEFDNNTKMTGGEFIKKVLAGEIDVGPLKSFFENAQGKTTVFDGKEWPTMFTLQDDVREQINGHIEQVYKICRENAIPITVVMQETNVEGIGMYNVMGIIPRERSGRKITEVGNIIHAFIGDGSCTSDNVTLDYEATRIIANITAILWKAKQNALKRDEFLDLISEQTDRLATYIGFISNSMDLSQPEPVEPSEDDEKEL